MALVCSAHVRVKGRSALKKNAAHRSAVLRCWVAAPLGAAPKVSAVEAVKFALDAMVGVALDRNLEDGRSPLVGVTDYEVERVGTGQDVEMTAEVVA